MSEHAVVPCDVCGQEDDHPMIHVMGPWAKDDRVTINEPSFHFDCIPAQFESQVAEGDQHARTRGAIEAARAGKHGNALRKLIQGLDDDNNLDEVK